MFTLNNTYNTSLEDVDVVISKERLSMGLAHKEPRFSESLMKIKWFYTKHESVNYFYQENINFEIESSETHPGLINEVIFQ